MPQRLLRPGIRQSKRWNRVAYIEQSLYIRLLTLVDDYGRYEADPELIRSEAFPYGDPDGNPIAVPTIDGALLSIASKRLLVLYEHDGKKYLQLLRWKERVRSESKFPEPPKAVLLTNDSNCQQMLASPPSPSPTPTPSPSPSPSLEREQHFPECNGNPTLQEVLGYAATAGLAPWKAEDWFNEMQGCGWLDHAHRKIQNWQAVLIRVRKKWEADGRPAGPPQAKQPGKPAVVDYKKTLEEQRQRDEVLRRIESIR